MHQHPGRIPGQHQQPVHRAIPTPSLMSRSQTFPVQSRDRCPAAARNAQVLPDSKQTSVSNCMPRGGHLLEHNVTSRTTTDVSALVREIFLTAQLHHLNLGFSVTKSLYLINIARKHHTYHCALTATPMFYVGFSDHKQPKRSLQLLMANIVQSNAYIA